MKPRMFDGMPVGGNWEGGYTDWDAGLRWTHVPNEGWQSRPVDQWLRYRQRHPRTLWARGLERLASWARDGVA